MTTQTPENTFSPKTERPEPRSLRNRWVAGVALVTIGLISLVANFTDSPSLGMLIVPALGLIFTLWGLGVREIGLLIPGGILSGIGLGIYLIDGPFSHLSEEPEGGVFLLAFALGWVLITALSRLVGNRLVWWPLIPGGILAAIGGALIAGGAALEVLSWLGRLWPVGLIILGLYLAFRRTR